MSQEVELPKLPEAAIHYEWTDAGFRRVTTLGWTADQMQEYARQAMLQERQDAERYRWLRERAAGTLAGIAYGHSKAACEVPMTDPDAAIDAAMSQPARMCPESFNFCQQGCADSPCKAFDAAMRKP